MRVNPELYSSITMLLLGVYNNYKTHNGEVYFAAASYGDCGVSALDVKDLYVTVLIRHNLTTQRAGNSTNNP